MPYESFSCQYNLHIRGLVQDTSTGAWRFLLHVKRIMQGHNRPHVYAIRRSYTDFKRLHSAICPTIAVLPKLPVDSLFSFFVGETQTVLQKKRVVLEAILKAIENHPQARECTAFLEFAANTESYELYSEAPPSPANSFKEYNASYEVHKSTHNQLVHGNASAMVHHQPGSNNPELQRRRNSTPTWATHDEPAKDLADKLGPAGDRPCRRTMEANMENRVDFSRYSQT